MTLIDCRETHMRQISAHVAKTSGKLPTRAHSHHVLASDKEKLPYTDPKECYHISPSQHWPLEIGTFLHENSGDPAVKVCAACSSLLIFRLTDDLVHRASIRV
jgi:hypothetical protein